MNRLFLAFVALSTQLTATTYFIRTDGNDSCNGTVDGAGSSGNCAKRTIQAGVNLANAGDTVMVHSGTYTTASPIIASARSGSAGNLITIRGASGETITVNRINITHNYIVVQNFRVTSMGAFESAGISLQGSNDQAVANTIVGDCQPWVGGEGCNTGIFSGGTNNIISGNTLDGVNNSSSNSFGIGIYLSSASSANAITSNLLTGVNTPGRLFEIYGTGHTISQNEVGNCRGDFENGNVHVDVLQMFDTSSTNIVWEKNYIHDFAGQFVMFADNAKPGSINHWTFRNNVYANVASSAFIKSQDIYFYNNTFYLVGQTGNNAVIFSTDGEGNGINGQFRNNILIGNATSTSLGMVQTDSTTMDHNYYSTPSFGSRSSVQGTNNVNGGNPLFVAASNNCVTNTCNFRLGAGSPLIGVGATISGYTGDMSGNTRAATWDIGAYEYVTGGITAPPSLTATVR